MTEESSYVKMLLEKLNCLKNGWFTLNQKKNKLKKTAYMCSQELKKTRKKLKEANRENKQIKNEMNEFEKENLILNDRIILHEEKIDYYKKQEIEISLARSYKSTTSDDLNTKLICQNQEILERFHREEERCGELEEENDRLRDQKEKASKKILKLKLEVKRLNEETIMNIEEEGDTLEKQELKEQLLNEKELREGLEEDNEKLQEEKERVQIACDTYERKLNELIDKHNEDINIYEEEIEKLREDMDKDKVDREMSNNSLRRLFNSQIGESDTDFNNLKQSLINKKEIETENQNLKAENAELKLDLLNNKQTQMKLMNKYSLLKKRFKLKKK